MRYVQRTPRSAVSIPLNRVLYGVVMSIAYPAPGLLTSFDFRFQIRPLRFASFLSRASSERHIPLFFQHRIKSRFVDGLETTWISGQMERSAESRDGSD